MGQRHRRQCCEPAVPMCIFRIPRLRPDPPVAVTPGSGSPKQILSGSKDIDQPFPAGFPLSPFQSWGDAQHYLRNEDYETAGNLSCAAGVCTISTPGTFSHFSSALKAGARIYIAGSSPACTNNLCTISGVVNAATAVLSENLTITKASYRCYGWGIRIYKTTAQGNLTVGAAYKLAGSIAPVCQESLADHPQLRSGHFR